ncbi:uncharacterized protein A4U43_C07F35600 [Asparagus officinalis]|uniref:Uncharacterized protein n=1 Tax=Asparagus officinalis TaxID=4686 RepID=A0A5P1EKG2_ASPOF|nr:uncharacterized protein A4U43_C07F35600 [Asparagus officinalis]
MVMERWAKKLASSKGSSGEVISQARLSVARNHVKFKYRSRRAFSIAAESLALALEGIETADGETNARKDCKTYLIEYRWDAACCKRKLRYNTLKQGSFRCVQILSDIFLSSYDTVAAKASLDAGEPDR